MTHYDEKKKMHLLLNLFVIIFRFPSPWIDYLIENFLISVISGVALFLRHSCALCPPHNWYWGAIFGWHWVSEYCRSGCHLKRDLSWVRSWYWGGTNEKLSDLLCSENANAPTDGGRFGTLAGCGVGYENRR